MKRNSVAFTIMFVTVGLVIAGAVLFIHMLVFSANAGLGLFTWETARGALLILALAILAMIGIKLGR